MKSRQYQSYLLRIWQTDDEDEPVWRALLECPGTGERHGFASMHDLYHFLDAQTVADASQCMDSPRRGLPGASRS